MDLDGTEVVEEIAVTSEDTHFNNFITPTVSKPIALSIVPSAVGNSTKIFLCQIIKNGTVLEDDSTKMSYQLIYQSDFFLDAETISMESAITEINGRYYVSSENVIPYITSTSEGGTEKWLCAIGRSTSALESGFSYILLLKNNLGKRCRKW